LKFFKIAKSCCHHSHYETDFGIFSANGAENTKIGSLAIFD